MPFTILSVGNNTSQISATINYHTIAFQALEGNKLDDVSSIPIQIQYAEIAEEFPLGFDSSELGFDGKSIGYASDSPVKYNFTLYFTVTAKKVGIYQGVKTEIDSYLAASGKRYKGDWFIWGGSEDTSVTYTGVVYSFKVSCAYIWNGVSWAIDDNPEHNSEAFNDIIGVANDMLENNNATANLALNRLVSNTVFCKRLVAATAFIQNLFAQNVTVENQLTVNNLKATNINMENGSIKNINAENGVFNNITVNGFYTSNQTPFQPMGMVNIGYNNSAIQLVNSKNVASIVRDQKGVYTVRFRNNIKLKTHTYAGNKYIDVFAVGNADDTFDSGFSNPLLVNPNWIRNYVDGRLTVDAQGYANVNYVVLYFIDNNTDQLIDPRSAQVFIYGTESD